MPLNIDIHAKVTPSTAQPTPVFTVPAAAAGLGAKSAKDAFLAVYETVKESLMTELKSRCEIDAGRFDYLTVAMDQNCQGGKLNSGICVVEVVQALLAGRDGALGQSKDALIFAAAVCGWSIEFMQAHFLVEDDIMDHSLTRRGKPCWYKMPGVNISMAINDGLIIFAWCTRMMELLVQWHPLYATLLQQLHNADFLTTIGQLYDTSAMYDKMDPEAPLPTTTEYTDYTLHTYNRIVKYKTAYYTYHVPLIMGLAVVGQLQTLPADKVEDLAVTMGEYFQVQDDFLDCYADPSVIGKIGTDIEDRKCSWLACTFLAHATEAQKTTFKANYGEFDPKKVAVIKQLFLDVDVPKHFETYQEAIVTKVDSLCAELESLNAGFVVAAKQLWARTYKRSK